MKNRIFWGSMLLLAVCLVMPLKAWAKQPISAVMNTDEVVFASRDDVVNEVGYLWAYADEDYAEIVSAVSSEEKVAVCKFDSSSITIRPVGVGECDVEVKDELDNKHTVHVVVKKSYIVDELKYNTSMFNCWYGTKKISVTSMEGAAGKLTVGKDSYQIFFQDKTEWSNEEINVKLNKRYKLNTKVKLSLTTYSNGVKCTYKKSTKITSGCSVATASADKKSKKKLTVNVNNLHKDDVVKVTYKGKTYTKKIKKDYDNKICKVVVKPKKKLKKNSKFKVVITNKDKKTLLSENFELSNWYYEPWDPDEDTGSEDYDE